MLADTAQAVGVAMIVLGAISYLLVLARRSWRGQTGCRSCAAALPPTRENPPAAKQFVPLENLTAAARRHRAEREAGAGRTA
jgi:hypothetical protein